MKLFFPSVLKQITDSKLDKFDLTVLIILTIFGATCHILQEQSSSDESGWAEIAGMLASQKNDLKAGVSNVASIADILWGATIVTWV